MLIKCLTLGSYETNCYIVSDGECLDCAVIDPGANAAEILSYLEELRLQCRALLLTHGHFDHTGALYELAEETGAPIYMHRNDDGVTVGGDDYRFCAPRDARFISDGDVIEVGKLRFQVMETPGHTPGSVSFLCTQGEDRALFSGDTLFRGSIGRTDFPGGSFPTILRSLQRLLDLPGDCEVYPGHMGPTSLERERHTNPFVPGIQRYI